MSFKSKLPAGARRGAIGAVLAVAAALLCYFSPLGGLLAFLSYDYLFVFKPRVVPDEVRLIYMDEKSAELLHQDLDNWDRGLHAALLDQLHRDQAALVVFDVLFVKPGHETTNQIFARAIQRHGKVVLAKATSREQRAGIEASAQHGPIEVLEDAAAALGIAEVDSGEEDGDGTSIMRRYHPGKGEVPSLPWAAARLVGAPSATNGALQPSECWLNFYGPNHTLPPLSYADALAQRSNYFQGKFVFIGRPVLGSPGGGFDQFRTPYSRWGGGYSPGVDFAATAFVNLWRNEWLMLMPERAEMALVIACGVLLGFGLGLVRPLAATVLAVLGVFGVAFAAVLLAHWEHVWFSWLLVAVVEIPCAWGWSVLDRRLRIRRRTETTGAREAPAATAAATVVPSPETSRLLTPSGTPAALTGTGGTRQIPGISDHTLLRCVGRGAYGEVWLARDVIGSFHAVKIVYRSSFGNDDPFEREFRGLQKYTPISRTHPGWVHVLHIGRHDAEGYFFCIMEAGDDEVSGQRIDPNSYQPRNLARELRKHGQLPIDECLRLGIALADALEHLHRHQLIHRDIKPSNVIFVQGVPKFADIGLVTQIRSGDEVVSNLGTEGFIAPEGPGAPSADVYSLGKLLYEISLGRDRLEFPELPTAVLDGAPSSHLTRFLELVMKACAHEPTRRYPSAAALRADLLALQQELPIPDAGPIPS